MSQHVNYLILLVSIVTRALMSMSHEELLERGDVQTLVDAVKKAIQEDNGAQADYWYVRFTERVHLDYTWLNSDQKELYADYSFYSLSDQIEELPSIKKQKKSYMNRREPIQTEAITWLEQIVQANKITGIEFRETFGNNTPDQQEPSAEELKKTRLETLKSYDPLQSHDMQ